MDGIWFCACTYDRVDMIAYRMYIFFVVVKASMLAFSMSMLAASRRVDENRGMEKGKSLVWQEAASTLQFSSSLDTDKVAIKCTIYYYNISASHRARKRSCIYITAAAK